MWRWLAVFLFGAALGAAFGVALGFFLFPYVFPPPEAKEQITQAEKSNLIAKGEFIHVRQSERPDPLRQGRRERLSERGVST